MILNGRPFLRIVVIVDVVNIRVLGETKLGRKEIDDFLRAVSPAAAAAGRSPALRKVVFGTGYYTQSSKTNIRTTTTTAPPIKLRKTFLAPILHPTGNLC